MKHTSFLNLQSPSLHYKSHGHETSLTRTWSESFWKKKRGTPDGRQNSQRSFVWFEVRLLILNLPLKCSTNTDTTHYHYESKRRKLRSKEIRVYQGETPWKYFKTPFKWCLYFTHKKNSSLWCQDLLLRVLILRPILSLQQSTDFFIDKTRDTKNFCTKKLGVLLEYSVIHIHRLNLNFFNYNFLQPLKWFQYISHSRFLI